MLSCIIVGQGEGDTDLPLYAAPGFAIADESRAKLLLAILYLALIYASTHITILLVRHIKGEHMSNPATTKMSSKGQVVIPEDIRKRLNLKSGSQFVVMGEDGVVILKTIEAPSMKDFDALVNEARKQAKLAGLKQSDIATATTKARSRK
jgi:AbrB family looped-hinge helix DNA binding protein